MVKLTIDGKEVTAEPGKLLIDVIHEMGTEIPHYCYHEALTIAGSCRLCMVEVEGAPKPMISCNTTVREGMVVHTGTDGVKNARRSVLEFLLLNHPVDCPECDKAGECLLQDYSFKYGNDSSRFTEPKRVPPFKDLGPHIKIATTRCIMCTRCVRFMDEVAGEPQLTVEHRGYHSEIVSPVGVELDHPLAGNVVDICPVGALLDKDFIHRTRVWHLTKTPSVCGECSTGCNVKIESYKNEVFRFYPRNNEEVNGHWMCDFGRESYQKYQKARRLSSPLVKDGEKQTKTPWDDALGKAAAGLGEFKKTAGAVAGLVSPSATNEDAFAVKQLLKKSLNSESVTGLFKQSGKDQVFKSGFVIKGDKHPNQAGLAFVFGSGTLDYDGESVLKEIESGKIKAVYLVKNDLSEVSERLVEALKKAKFLVVESIVESPLTKLADVVLPGYMYYEKTGTFVNYQKRLQWIQKAIDGPNEAKNTWEIAKAISGRLKQQLEWNSDSDVFLDMAKTYDKLEGLSHFKIGPLGKSLEKTKVAEEVTG